MNIVIVGDGKVGFTLADHLGKEGHDITIIDNRLHTLNETVEQLDVMGVHGNGASMDIQIEAGVAGADLLIAATSADELNMLCCLIAKNLGAKHTIARVRNPEYRTQLQMLQEQFGLSMVINPELETAREISRVIRFPNAVKVETFSKGRVELVEFRLHENMTLVGQKLLDLPKITDSKVLICAVERGGEVIIPSGSFMPKAGDKLHITGENQELVTFMRQIGDISIKVRTVMIVGGGRITYYLAKLLEDRNFQVKIIEKKLERCDELCEMFPRATIIHGDGSDTELLEAEGLEETDAFVALTNIDEENLIMSMVANYKKVPKIITKTGRFNYLSIMEKIGIDSIVNPKDSTANQIIQYVRAMQNSLNFNNIQTLYKLVDGKAEAVEFIATEDTQNLRVPLQELALKQNLLLAVIVRGNKVIIPHGRDYIEANDSVVVITNEHRLAGLNDIFNS